MIKEFVKYKEALELKQLGFNEPCFRWFDERFKDDLLQDRVCGNDALFFTDLDCSAPIFQQAFRWFREKHGLFVEIKCCNTKRINGTFEIEISRLNDRVYGHYGYETYEEAEQTCLEKLIETIKNT